MNKGNYGLNRTGHGGVGRENNYDTARNYLKSFLQSSFVRLISLDDDIDLETSIANTEKAQTALCNVSFIEQFGEWLCNYAHQKSGEPLSLGSIGDYLSATKSIYNKLFPGNSIFNGSQEQAWYTNLRAKSNQEIARRDMRRGVQSSNKAKPIGRLQLKSVIGALLSINTNASIRKAVYIGTTFNSAGRSGEAAFMCLDHGAY